MSNNSTSSSDSPFRWVMLLGLVAVVIAAVYVFNTMTGDDQAVATNVLTHEVANGDLLVTVTEEGNVESASNVEVKCQVAGGSSILWIVADGKQVKKGEKIVELDSSALEDQINTQRIAYEKARATKMQSEKTYSVAKISVTEYLEGTYKQALQDAEALITIAEENLRAAKNSLDHSEKMFRKGYVSELDMEGSRFAVDRAELELGSATTARDVLVKFTKEKTLEDLRSQRDNAEAQMKSDAAAFELEETRLKRLEDQLSNCLITAPQDGMVVYANERGGRFGQSQATIEEGVAVRERQTILRLPDLEQMQVKVNVHESKVDQVRPGMRARIRILENEFTGVVTSIANQPEPTSFFSGNVKEYATYVRVVEEGDNASLRPGMTAEVEILIAHLKDVPALPVAAVVEKRGNYFAWVDAKPAPEKRPLLIGPSNDEFVEIKDGVVAGEKVLLNPRAVIQEAREMEDTEKVDVSKRFGEAPANTPGAGGPRGGPGGGPRAGGPGGGGPGGPGGGPRGGGPGGPGAGGPGGGGPRGGGPGGGGAGGGGGRPGGGMAALDKDGDGKISKDEAPDRMKDRFDSMDSNGDGFIDKAEQAALIRRFQQGGGGAGGGRPGGN